ncbi:Kelch repeat-containing protein [Methanoregula sp.]|uniref:sialidase family protein n=1 Tax=Methanoregula sp. TaxID=2052170 RepID=UPI003C7659DB
MPDGSIVLIGGDDGTPRNDVWRSTDDGATWTEMTANTGWTPRQSPGSVVMPDRSIIVFGGTIPGGYTQLNDVWRSTDDGATWTQVNLHAGWSPRYGQGSVVMPDGSIVLTGGFSFGPGYLNDVWRSTDEGITWTEVNASAGWSKRYFHSSLVMPDGSIVLIAGGYNNQVFMNDTWRSTDNGATWTEESPSAGWTGRMGQGSLLMPDGSIVLMGGNDGSRYRNDVWRLMPNEWSAMAQSSSIYGNNEDFEVSGISQNSSILISKTITPQVIKQNTDAQVTITLTNSGLTPIHDIEVVDEPLPEFPVLSGQIQYTIPQMLLPNETRILIYTINATNPGKYTFNGTSVMYAGDDGNYHVIHSNASTVIVLKPLIPSPTPDQSFDLGRIISDFFRRITPY